MGWMPGAVKRDVGAPGNYSNGQMHSYTGVVLHVNDAASGDLFGWITGGSSDMSCHFQVTTDGTVYQYIDTQYSSWCQMAGNDDYLSIETSGFPNQPLTAQQVAACAQILAYVNAQHGIPLTVTDTVGQRGLIAHGDGGAAWGGHTGCPGDLRKAQRPAILSQAASLSTGGFLMALTDAQQATLLANVNATLAAVAAIKPQTDRITLVQGKVDKAAWAILGDANAPGVRAVLSLLLNQNAELQTTLAAVEAAAKGGPVDITGIAAAVRAEFTANPLTLGGTVK